MKNNDVKLENISTHKGYKDARGSLYVGEFLKEIPFLPKRYFSICDVPMNNNTRGNHAHHECEQYLVCLSGKIKVDLNNGSEAFSYNLTSPSQGLYIPVRTWGVQTFLAPNSILIVFASHYFEEADYIRNYQDFINLVKK